MANYWFYYFPMVVFINHHGKEFDFLGLNYFRYLTFKCSMYRPQKTRIPALAVEIILFGIGFSFCTHTKR